MYGTYDILRNKLNLKKVNGISKYNIIILKQKNEKKRKSCKLYMKHFNYSWVKLFKKRDTF